MATPIVSGTAALVLARFPELTHLEVKELMLRTVARRDDLTQRIATGGILDARAALEDKPLPVSITMPLNALSPAVLERFQREISVTDKKRIEILSPPARLQMNSPERRGDASTLQNFSVDLSSSLSEAEVKSLFSDLNVSKAVKTSPGRNVWDVEIVSPEPQVEIERKLRTKPGVESVETGRFRAN